MEGEVDEKTCDGLVWAFRQQSYQAVVASQTQTQQNKRSAHAPSKPSPGLSADAGSRFELKIPGNLIFGWQNMAI